MDKVRNWSEPVLDAAVRTLQNFIEYLPHLLAGLGMLLVGYLVAKTVRALTMKIFSGVDRLAAVPVIGPIASGRLDESTAKIIGNAAFWLVLLFFATSATSLLGLKMFAGWLDGLIGYLPGILSGVLIIVAGLIIGTLVHDTIQSAAKTMPPRPRSVLARAGQIFTLVTLIVVGVDQIGIDITVLIAIVGITVGALLGGVAIAFGLGSRTLVSNLIAARYLGRDYQAGKRVRIGKVEGTILEITPVAVILDTADGRMTVPAKMFSEDVSVLLTKGTIDAG